MMSIGRMLTGALVALLLTLAIGVLSRLPAPESPTADAALRFSWRLRSEEAGECRHPTAEELAELPAHMRNPDACVGAVPDYRLRVRVNGTVRFDDRIAASGVRGDRPLFVYRELRLPPGRHELQVRFAPEDGSEAVTLGTQASVTLAAGEVMLVTRNEDTGALEIVRPKG